MSQKLTRTPDGETVQFKTMRGHPDRCSIHCGGVYSFEGDKYCKYFFNDVGKRDPRCIANEVKEGSGNNGFSEK